VNFEQLLQSKDVILFDGGMGTEIFKQGLNPGKVPDLLNVEKPEIVQNILANYFNHADLVQTCTFSSNTICLSKNNASDHLKQVNTQALDNINKVRPEGKLIVGDIGPSGEFRPPVGSISPEQWKNSFKDQVEILESGIDVWHIETISDIQEMEAAINAIKEVSQKPIMASMTYRKTKKGFFTIMGDSPSTCVEILEKHNVDVIGTNCTIGSDEMIELSAELVSLSKKPILVKPNAGLPRLEYSTGQTHYDQKSTDFVQDIHKMIDHGVKIVGGCCGTSAEHIKLLRELLNSL
jgi:5-methyltetrahydrofolate--homocysteine methyltransferase